MTTTRPETEYVDPCAVRAVRRAMLRGMSLEDKYRIRDQTGYPVSEIEAAAEYLQRRVAVEPFAVAGFAVEVKGGAA